jgi:hypothetical protein
VASRLVTGQRLSAGWYLQSPNRDCEVLMQTDGNLVLLSPSHVPLWASGTNGHRGAYARLDPSGHFLIRSSTGGVLSQTPAAGPSAHLEVRNDADISLLTTHGSLVWSVAA